MTAKIVDGPFNEVGRPSKYDLDKCVDGKWRERACGSPGDSAKTFRAAVYAFAKYRGLCATTSSSGNKVRFRIFEKEEG